MGLTLPVIIEDQLLRQTQFSRAIAFLYGSNTLGAMAGAVLSEAYLIRTFGLRGTALAAGSVVCIAAAIAVLAARFGVRGHVRAFKAATSRRTPKVYREPRPAANSFAFAS